MDRVAVAIVLPAHATSAARARDLVTSSCLAWACSELCDDVALVATELVVNAIRHAGTDLELRMQRIPGGVRLEVSDQSTRPLRPRAAEASDEGGRGLLLVDALSHRYGVEAEERGKRVWAELLTDTG